MKNAALLSACTRSTAPSMANMPVNRMPKPSIIWPMLRFLGLLKNTNSTAPMNATTGLKVLGWMRVSSRLSPEISARRMSWPVTVVPMLAPMMTPTAWVRSRMPLFTRPTTITMVPQLLWITPVIRVPSSTPRRVFAVSFCSTACIWPPASFSSPDPIMDMPYKNSATPPARSITSKTDIKTASLPAPAPERRVKFG